MSTQIEITYTFNASRELVFKAFTESEHLQCWWGPKGWLFEVAEADFRSGGVFHYSQKPADGDIMWVKFIYSEVVESEKITYTSVFSDKEGNIVRAPFDANWPLKTLNSITFFEDKGKTALTMIVVPEAPTEAESKTFDASEEMIHSGFTGTFDQLAAYLTKM
ncbi:SRPBCC domain-containing protein [Paenibacillus sp. 1011MAR3C5]|uniref:SRPBCC family protein n=1 Tax=Paenibacillus sp. 1011MAR3C5 TaxID=1675787 RepID=UPI000E6BBA1F|nr:SRPBCC domain-containing protein [Paenibacillus sp. 1011MAR3C5]RJE91007.1 SRPBCC domain-containing protein [Paenibacillus sp. 1011MAR3C5]